MGCRIGFDVTSALNQGGGIGRYTRELIQALVVEAPQFDFSLFSARPPAIQPVPNSLPVAPNVTHRPAPLAERWLYRLWYRARFPLPVQTFTGRIDLFHSPDFVLPPVSGRIPTLLTVHDLSFIRYPETFPPKLINYLNRSVPPSVRRATHILADSVSTMRDLQTQWNVDPERITVLYSGVNERFRPQTDGAKLAAIRSRYGLGDAPFVLAVGTVQPRKNYEMLVRAFAPVAERHPHTLLIVGGKGWLSEGLTAEIERHDLRERVRLAGFIDDEDLPGLYTLADLFVFPSLYEGFGLPLLEAMACGTPVITSNASSLPEVVLDEYLDRQRSSGGGSASAVLLSPHDETAWSEAMLRLLADEKARHQLVEAGFARITRFSWQTAARRLTHLYSELLQSPHS